MRETKITNPGERYHRASLIEPSHSGYVHIAAQIDPPTRPGPARPTRARDEALAAMSSKPWVHPAPPAPAHDSAGVC